MISHVKFTQIDLFSLEILPFFSELTEAFKFANISLQTFVAIVVFAGFCFLGSWYIKWCNYAKIINKIPGPPVHPVIPWLGHAGLVLDLDKRKFPFGTYVCKF